MLIDKTLPKFYQNPKNKCSFMTQKQHTLTRSDIPYLPLVFAFFAKHSATSVKVDIELITISRADVTINSAI